jgi:chitin synthase
VYDVTGYYNSETKFFSPLVQSMFTDFNGKDATKAWNMIAKVDSNAPLYLKCMKHMFYIGMVDHRLDLKCQVGNYLLLSVSFLLVSVIGFKFLAALQCSAYREPENHDKYVICQIPCFTEGYFHCLFRR